MAGPDDDPDLPRSDSDEAVAAFREALAGDVAEHARLEEALDPYLDDATRDVWIARLHAASARADEGQGRLVSTTLAVLEAERVSDEPDDLLEVWEALLEAAAAAHAVSLAGRAVERLRAAAWDLHDGEEVLALTRRLAEIAEAASDSYDAVLARYEEALLLAQGGDPEAGEAAARTAREHARQHAPQLVPRGGLVLGRVLEDAGKRQGAHEVYDTLRSELAGRVEFAPVSGRAGLGVARTLRDVEGALERRREALVHARDAGRSAGDAELYAEAMIGLAALHTEEGDLANAVDTLVEGRIWTEAMDGEEMLRAFDRTFDLLAEMWGRERVQAEIRRAVTQNQA